MSSPVARQALTTYTCCMPKPLAVLALSTALVGAGLASAPELHAARVAASTTATAVGTDAAHRARMLDGHGEPGLAWQTLAGGHADPSDDVTRLEIRLLTELGRYREADSLLARLPAGKDARSTFLYYLQRARLNYDQGRFDSALQFLAAADPSGLDPALTAYGDVLAARSAVSRGDWEGGAARLARVRAAGTPEALRPEVDRERLRAFRALDRSDDALAAAIDAVASAEDARTQRAMMRERYLLAWECNRSRDAVAAAMALFDAFRNSVEAEACAVDLLNRDTSMVPTATVLACADVLLVRNRTDDLRRALRSLDARQLSGRDGEALRMAWAEYHYQTGDYSRAIALSRPSYSDTALRRRSMLVMARSLRKLGRQEDAAAVYEHFVNAYPNDALAAEALYAAASLYEQAGRDATSTRVLDQLRRSYPSTFHGWAAAIKRANRLAADGHGDQAVAIYDQWLARSRRTDEAALYYLSREYDAARGAGAGALVLNELRTLNPYSFYLSPGVSSMSRGPVPGASGTVAATGGGTLAEWLQRADAARDQAYQRVLSVAETVPSSNDSVVSGAIARGVWFLNAGFRDWAGRELDVARNHCGDSAEQSLQLARVYEDYAMPWRSVRLYERARSNLSWERRRDHADDFRYLTCPLPYPAQVLDSAARNGVPPHLVYGLIREESRFEADVVSRAGAVGLMQLMPDTAKRIASQIDLNLDIDTLGDPDVNVALGVWYAADLLRAGDGSVAWMLAAYNAGPGAASRWLTPGVSGKDAIDAVESIDYKETRGYVKRVVESANLYHALYFGGGDNSSIDSR